MREPSESVVRHYSMSRLADFMRFVKIEAETPNFLDMVTNEPELLARTLSCFAQRLRKLEERSIFGGIF